MRLTFKLRRLFLQVQKPAREQPSSRDLRHAARQSGKAAAAAGQTKGHARHADPGAVDRAEAGPSQGRRQGSMAEAGLNEARSRQDSEAGQGQERDSRGRFGSGQGRRQGAAGMHRQTAVQLCDPSPDDTGNLRCDGTALSNPGVLTLARA